MHQLALKRPKTIELGQVLSLLSATFKLLTLGASFKRVCLCIAQRFRVIRAVSSWTVLFLRFHQTCSNWWNSFGTFFLFLWTTPRGIDLRTNQSKKNLVIWIFFSLLRSLESWSLLSQLCHRSTATSLKKNSSDLVDPFVHFFVCSAPLMSFLLPFYFAHIRDLPAQIFVVVLGTMRAP